MTLPTKLREFARLPGESRPTKISFGSGLDLIGSLFDESFGGLGVDVESTVPLAAGMKLTVEYYGQPMRAVVRSVTPLEGGQLRLGLQWDEAKRTVRKPIQSASELRAQRRTEQRQPASIASAASRSPAGVGRDANAARLAFLREMSGGLFKLQSLLGRGNYAPLADCLKRFAFDAEELQLPELARAADSLLSDIAAGAPKNQLTDNFEGFLDLCLAAAEESAGRIADQAENTADFREKNEASTRGGS